MIEIKTDDMGVKRGYKPRKPGGGRKKRKPLITAGVYESDVAEKVQDAFEKYRETQDYKTALLSTAAALDLSKASVTSYLPYQKGVYFPSTEKEKISVGAERQRRYRAIKRWRGDPTEENFWSVVVAYVGVKFKTYSGLPFTYEIKKGRNGEYTKELWIDRREKSKSLDRQGTVCCAWEKTAFEEGLKGGMRLMVEVLGV